MLIPRYIFTDDFSDMKSLIETEPYTEMMLAVGDFLWSPAEPLEYIHYIMSGIARTYLVHETGRRKIISYHGVGTIFPVFHELDFKLEQSLVTEAMTPMKTWRFRWADIKRLVEQQPKLYRNMVAWYARYVNLLLFETAHQEYNSGFVKVCNVLWLLHSAKQQASVATLELAQEELAELLGMSRVNVTRHLGRLRSEGIIDTSRKCISIIRLDALLKYCSGETRNEDIGKGKREKGKG